MTKMTPEEAAKLRMPEGWELRTEGGYWHPHPKSYLEMNNAGYMYAVIASAVANGECNKIVLDVAWISREGEDFSVTHLGQKKVKNSLVSAIILVHTVKDNGEQP